jgi:hypothetical protein
VKRAPLFLERTLHLHHLSLTSGKTPDTLRTLPLWQTATGIHRGFSETLRAARHYTTLCALLDQPDKQNMTGRWSSVLRVILSRSRYSNRGMTYFLDRRVICLKRPMFKDAAGHVQQEGKMGSTRRELDCWLKTRPQSRTIGHGDFEIVFPAFCDGLFVSGLALEQGTG